MVSDDTESRTIALLESNNYFGLKKEHVDIVK
jgi:UDP-sugar pyrophosphorylase